MKPGRASSNLLSCTAAWFLPFLLALYWPLNGMGLGWAPMAVRAGVLLCASLLVLLWWKAPTTKNEVKWTILFGGYWGSLLIPSLLATDVPRAITNWSRILMLLTVCLALARAFRNAPTRKAFGIGALSGSLLLTAYIIVLYLSYSGFAMPTYESTRILKSTVLHGLGIGFNPMAFSSAFLCILALCILRRSVWLYSTLAIVIAVGTCLTGSRTPFALVIASLTGVAFVGLLQRREKLVAYASVLSILAVLGTIVYLAIYPLDIHRWSVITEGRVDIWTVGWAKFLEKPFTGFGAESWRDDLVSRMPGYYEYAGSLVRMRTGGYHNAYLTLLAEEGLPVFCMACSLLVFAFSTCLRGVRGAVRVENQWMLLFGLIFVTLRGVIEVPGLFGYGQDPAEFTAYAFLSLVIASSVAKPARSSSVQPITLSRASAHSSLGFAH